jgi:hypothetical protein
MKLMLLINLFLAALLTLAGCAAEPADGPGLCKLRCSDAIITTKDYKITVLTDNYSLKCGEIGVAQTHRVTSKFLVTRKRQTASGVEDVAVPSVSVRPATLGLYDPSIDEEGVGGVVTSSSNWCSDQCGVVSIDWNVVCPLQGDGQAIINLFSGALASEKSMKIDIQAATFEDDDDGGNLNSNSSGNETGTSITLLPE